MKTRSITWAAVAALLSALPACGRGPAPARVVLLDSGLADTAEIASFPDHWAGQVMGGHPAAWLGPGSFLLANAPVPYLTSDGGRLRPGFTGWSASVSGHVVSLDLGKDSAVAWLEHASPADLARLRLVSLHDSVPTAARPALQRLAAANPAVGLSFESSAETARTLPLFRPRVLAVPELAAAGPLARLRQVETLFIGETDSGSLDGLRGLAALRRLILENWTLFRVRQLPPDLEALTALDSKVDVSAVGDLPRLRALVLTGSEWTKASDLAGLPKLRWLGLPKNATQAEFAALVRAHPDLEVVELIGVDSVSDLSPLRGARHLKAVTLDGTYADLGVLRDLKSLEFVGLSKGIWEKSPDQVAAIRAALPTAAIVKVTPLCLGSGWILLLLPAALLGLLARRRSRRTLPTTH
jgi:hypothetical protein